MVTNTPMWDWALVVFVAALALAAFGVRQVMAIADSAVRCSLTRRSVWSVGALMLGNS